MKVATGLRPEVMRVHLAPSGRDDARWTHQLEGGYLVEPVPSSLGSTVWAVRFTTAVDTVERRAGEVRASMILPAEPRVIRRGFSVYLLDEEPLVGQHYEAEARKRHRCPADAIVIDDRDPEHHLTLRSVEWWEVEA